MILKAFEIEASDHFPEVKKMIILGNEELNRGTYHYLEELLKLK